jgi:hypothetical protein
MSKRLNLAALEKKVDAASRQAMKKVKAGKGDDPFLCGENCGNFPAILGLEGMMAFLPDPE